MVTSITIDGILNAVENLGYKNKNTPKYKILEFIVNHYKNSQSPDEIRYIDTDLIVKAVWETGNDDSVIKSKKKNFSSLKTAINSDLEKLYEKGDNSEGIILSPENTFVLSDLAKNKIITNFSDSFKIDDGLSLGKVSDILNSIRDFISNIDSLKGTDLKNDINAIKSVIESMSKKVPPEDQNEGKRLVEISDDEEITKKQIPSPDSLPGDIDNVEVLEDDSEIVEVEEEDTEIIEVDEDEDLEVLEDDSEIVEVEDEDTEIIEVDEDEDFEVIEDDSEIVEVEDEDTEIIEVDEDEDLEVLEDDSEIVEVEDEDTEIIEVDEDEDLEVLEDDSEIVEVEDEDTEIIEVDEDEDLEVLEDDSEIVEVEDEDTEIIEVDEDEDLEVLEDDSEIVEVEDEDTEIIEVDEDEDLEVLEDDSEIVEVEDEDTEIIEVDEDEDLEVLEDDSEIVEVEDEDTEIIEVDEDEDLEVLEDDSEIVEVEDEDTEIIEVDEDEDLEVLEDDSEIVEVEDEDTEIIEVDEDEDLEVLEDDSEIVEVEDEDTEVIEDEEAIELEDDEELEVIDDSDNIEILDEGEDFEEIDERALNQSGMPIDAFSDEFKIDPEKLLSEQFDGYLGAMERFYNQYLIIPGGNYTVGSHRGVKNVMPISEEQIETFYMSKFPVTNALFEVFVEKTGYVTSAEKKGFGFVYHGRFLQKNDRKTGRKISVWQASLTRQKTEGAFWYQPFGPSSNLHGKRNHPVVQVSLEDARAFAAWTGKSTPTEIEWEAAARTYDYMLYPWGNEWIPGRCNVESSAISDTTAVDAYPNSVNPFEIEDLAGNVYEWTETVADTMSSPDSGRIFYIAKGGSWISPDAFDMSMRNIFPSDFTSNIIGLRCVAR